MKKRIYLSINSTQEEQDIIEYCKQKLKECRVKENMIVLIHCNTQEQKEFLQIVQQYITLVDKDTLKKNIDQFNKMVNKMLDKKN